MNQSCEQLLENVSGKLLPDHPKPDGKKLWKEADKLMRNLQSASDWNAPEFLGGKLNPNFHFQPARWFRGLDVAGDENALKIEWFAPVLRWLRSGFKSRPNGERASTGFHLSIHAGEDYAHPASAISTRRCVFARCAKAIG